jgi:hypothetical protein
MGRKELISLPLLLLGMFFVVSQAMAQDSGDCCYSHSGTGCEDSACEASVCSYDSWCCDFGWDSICAGEALSDSNCNCGSTEACCFTNGSCQDLTMADCTKAGGTAQGSGTNCATTVCSKPLIPSLTPWGLIAAAAVLGLIGVMRIRRRRNG